MERRHFLRLAILTLLAEPAMKLEPFIITQKKKRYYAFKCSQSILKDKEQFNELLELHKDYIEGKLVAVETGWENDDFANDKFTIKLTFES
jgi:hypothetical protein